MAKYTAGQIGDNPKPYIGETVEFRDYHGRPVSGTLADASAPANAAYATLKVDGRDCAVFRNTPVEVA